MLGAGALMHDTAASIAAGSIEPLTGVGGSPDTALMSGTE